MSTGWYTPRTLRARRSSRAKISCGIPGNFVLVFGGVGSAVLAAFAYAAIRLPDTLITTPQAERALASEQAQRRSPK
jgi:hypothetical protein